MLIRQIIHKGNTYHWLGLCVSLAIIKITGPNHRSIVNSKTPSDTRDVPNVVHRGNTYHWSVPCVSLDYGKLFLAIARVYSIAWGVVGDGAVNQ